MTLKQLTVRGLDDDIVQELHRIAQEEGLSLNQSVRKLLRRGLSQPDNRDDGGVIGNSLDDLFGTWSAEEADEFDRAVAHFAVIDEEMWR